MASLYHPWFNELGTMKDVNGKNWHEVGSLATSTFNCFLPANVGTVSGRPNGEVATKPYKNQSRDLRLLAYAPDKTTSLRNEARDNENGSAVGVEGMVELIYSYNALTTATGADHIYVPSNNSITIGDIVTIQNATTLVTTICTVVNKGTDGNGEYFFVSNTLTYTIGDVIAITKKSPHSFSSEYTMTDLIGSPANYPNSLKSRLASGKGVLINPLLVGQDGSDYVTFDLVADGAVYPVASKKSILFHNQVISDNSGGAWGSSTPNNNYINNTTDIYWFNDDRRLVLQSYQAKTNSTKSLPIGTTVATLDKVYASNSHSIYKGGTAVASGIGKIPTGNGSNGFESGYLENAIVGYDIKIVTDSITLYSAVAGDILGVYGSNLYADGTTFISTTFNNLTFTPNADFVALGLFRYTNIYTIPSHQTIALDNSDSMASKRFYTLEKDSDNMAQLAMYTAEMKWDFTADSGSEFTAVTGSTAQNANPVGTKLKITSGSFTGYYIVESLQSSSSWDVLFSSGSYIGIGGNIYTSSGVLMATKWDGNGFGDSNLFEQLTDGTLTDDNANTIITSRTARRLNYFIGDK